MNYSAHLTFFFYSFLSLPLESEFPLTWLFSFLYRIFCTRSEAFLTLPDNVCLMNICSFVFTNAFMCALSYRFVLHFTSS